MPTLRTGPALASSAPSSTVVPLDCDRSPVDLLRLLSDHRPALLESRTAHPGARHSILAIHPVREVTLWRDAVEDRRGARVERTRLGDPLEFLERLFDSPRPTDHPDLPFLGGWVGYLAHEAAVWILKTPAPPPAPPARPEFPLGFFRLYADAAVLDHRTRQWILAINDLPGLPKPPERRLDELRRLVETAPAPAVVPPARARPEPAATLDPDAFRAGVARLQEYVREGDCFQVNLTSSVAYPWDTTPTRAGLVSLYDAYAGANPGAWSGYFETPHFSLLSASPELLADARRGRLRLRPIAGTRGRGRDDAEDERLATELRADPKERAEHAMLVDLARNDAATLCRPGTVRVTQLAGLERYRHVMHLVSEVEGDLDGPASPVRLLRAVFPGGTVTGCPKRRAVQRIAELEGGPRGPYTGTLGYVSLHGASQWNLLIRTLVATPTHLVVHAGCGIVEGSRPEAEAAELEAKARAQVQAALGWATPAPPEARCGDVEAGPAWQPAAPLRRRTDRRVLLIDFEDSFVHNLADYCRRLDAATLVHSIHDPVAPAWDEPPTHLILSPGPGRPEDFPQWRDHLARAERLGLPVLGVCLGHQALAQHAGAHVVRHPVTVHGKASRILKTEAARQDPILRRWRGASAARYHSLVATDLPDAVRPLATLEDGTCMAARIQGRLWWGLQFHPESLLTESGLDLLDAFLEVDPNAQDP